MASRKRFTTVLPFQYEEPKSATWLPYQRLSWEQARQEFDAESQSKHSDTSEESREFNSGVILATNKSVIVSIEDLLPPELTQKFEVGDANNANRILASSPTQSIEISTTSSKSAQISKILAPRKSTRKSDRDESAVADLIKKFDTNEASTKRPDTSETLLLNKIHIPASFREKLKDAIDTKEVALTRPSEDASNRSFDADETSRLVLTDTSELFLRSTNEDQSSKTNGDLDTNVVTALESRKESVSSNTADLSPDSSTGKIAPLKDEVDLNKIQALSASQPQSKPDIAIVVKSESFSHSKSKQDEILLLSNPTGFTESNPRILDLTENLTKQGPTAPTRASSLRSSRSRNYRSKSIGTLRRIQENSESELQEVMSVTEESQPSFTIQQSIMETDDELKSIPESKDPISYEAVEGVEFSTKSKSFSDLPEHERPASLPETDQTRFDILALPQLPEAPILNTFLQSCGVTFNRKTPQSSESINSEPPPVGARKRRSTPTQHYSWRSKERMRISRSENQIEDFFESLKPRRAPSRLSSKSSVLDDISIRSQSVAGRDVGMVTTLEFQKRWSLRKYKSEQRMYEADDSVPPAIRDTRH